MVSGRGEGDHSDSTVGGRRGTFALSQSSFRLYPRSRNHAVKAQPRNITTSTTRGRFPDPCCSAALAASVSQAARVCSMTWTPSLYCPSTLSPLRLGSASGGAKGRTRVRKGSQWSKGTATDAHGGRHVRRRPSEQRARERAEQAAQAFPGN